MDHARIHPCAQAWAAAKLVITRVELSPRLGPSWSCRDDAQSKSRSDCTDFIWQRRGTQAGRLGCVASRVYAPRKQGLGGNFDQVGSSNNQASKLVALEASIVCWIRPVARPGLGRLLVFSLFRGTTHASGCTVIHQSQCAQAWAASLSSLALSGAHD